MTPDISDCPLYSDPELYDSLFPGAGKAAHIEDDARRARIVASERFYLEEARRCRGRVLELACGSGRLTIPIAQEGIEIVGSDLSDSMLEAARAKAAAAGVDVPFVQADMRSFDLPGPFAGILIPGNSLLHLMTVEDLRRCFKSVRRHLAKNGRLVFDVSHFRPEALVGETAGYDAATQIRDLRLSISNGQVIEYRLRVIFPQELLLLIDAAGFEVEYRFGEFTRVPFESASPRQVLICRLL